MKGEFEGVHLSLPFSVDDTKALKFGDVVYLSGTAYQLRGPAHERVVEYLKSDTPIPFPLRESIIYHSYSCTTKTADEWRLDYVGPTLSFRMEKYLPEIIQAFSIRAIVAKAGAGLTPGVVEVMREHGCIHLVQVGGTPAFHREMLENRITVYWEDLGPEKVVEYRFREFGPLVVSVDADGRQLFKEGSFKAQELYR